MPCTEDVADVPAPWISLHPAHSAIPGLLRSFPVPTPVGFACKSSQPLCTPEAQVRVTPAILSEIVSAARTAGAAQASILRSEISGHCTPGMSDACCAVVRALAADDAARRSSVSSSKSSSRLSGALTGGESFTADPGAAAKQDVKLEPRDDDRMVLRPRKGSALPVEMQRSPSVSSGIKSEGPAEPVARPKKKDAKVERAADATKKTSSEAPREAPPAAVESSSLMVADCIRRLRVDSETLASLINALVDAPPTVFAGVTADAMAAYLATLMEVPATPLDPYASVLRTLTCLSVLSHKSVDAKWLSDDLVEHTLVGVASAVRHMKRRLQQAEQAAGDADGGDAKRSRETELRKERDDSKKRIPSDASRLLGALRTMCRLLALLCADAASGIISEANVLRVEDFAFAVLCCGCDSPRFHDQVLHFLHREALLLTAVVWNRIEQHREAAFITLCDRISRTGPQLLKRNLEVTRDVHVMPLTAVLLNAVQSWPLYASPITRTTVEAYFQQINVWAAAIITRVFNAAAASDDADTAPRFVVQFLEDLCLLLCQPAYAAADALLRALMFGLARAHLQGDDSSSEAPQASNDKLGVLVVDALGRVAQLLHQHASRESKKPVDLSAAEDAFLSEWQMFTSAASASAAVAPAKKKSKKDAKERLKDVEEKVVAPERTLTALERCACTLYTAMTERVATADTATAAMWFHSRRAQLFLFARSNILPLESSDAYLDALCRRMANAMKSSACASLDDDALHSVATFIAGHYPKSCLHLDARDAVATMLLQVVRVNSSSSAWDALRKKAMSHLARLLELQPALMRVAWPVAAQTLRDDAARVRESSAQLLHKLLHAAVRHLATQARGATEETVDVRPMVANILSGITLLLGDRASTVLQKALTIAEEIVGLSTPEAEDLDKALALTDEGVGLQRYLQLKLVGLLESGEHGAKYHKEIANIFFSRWLSPLAPRSSDDGISAAPRQQNAMRRMVTELSWLATYGLPAPFEILDGALNPAVLVLREVMTAAQNASSSTTRARKGKAAFDAETLRGLMAECAKTIVHGVFAEPPVWSDCGRVLAGLHAVCIANAEWVEGVAEAVASLVQYDATKPGTEDDATRLLQAARILSTLQRARGGGLPMLQETLVQTATVIIAKYSGCFQQRVLVAAVGTVCSLVEAAPAASSCKYLRLWYQHVNSYYAKTATLLHQLSSTSADIQQTVGYLTRFVFLLSECLRSYHDWVKPGVAKLFGDPSMTAPNANRLASERGVAGNIQWLVEQLLDKCSGNPRAVRLMPLAVRLVGSLCIADPPTYFRANETAVLLALENVGDAQQQTQGLLIVRDFLVEEDARVTRAAAQQQAASKSPASTLRRAGSADDMNSGMATWVVQRFHSAVVHHCTSSTSPLVRQLALEIMDVALQQGLIPPSILVEALMALQVDPDSASIAERARRVLTSVADRHEEAMAPKVVSGIMKAFDFLCDCGKHDDILSCAVQPPTDIQPHLSVHEVVYRLIGKHKKHRENVLVGLCRALYTVSKHDEWLAVKRPPGCSPRSISGLLTLLRYVALTVALLPLQAESDVLTVLAQCSAGIDVHLQTAMDHASAWQESVSKLAKPAKGKQATQLPTLAVSPSDVVQCIAVALLGAVKRFGRKEYGVSAAKLAKFTTASGADKAHGASAARREPRSAATAEFLSKVAAIKEACGLAAEGLESEPRCLTKDAIAALCSLVEEVYQEECSHLVLEDSAAGSATATTKGKARRLLLEKPKRQQKKRRQRDDSTSSDGSESSDSDA